MSLKQLKITFAFWFCLFSYT